MLILFDIDDTLFDDAGAVRAGVKTLYPETSRYDSLEDFESAWFAALELHYDRYLDGETSFRGQRRARIREVIDPTLPSDLADRVFARYSEAYESAWSLCPDVMPCLDALADRTLGIVSNGEDARQREKLSHAGILERFACVVTSGGFGCAKPDPSIFLHACGLSGAAPSDALYVGDRYEADALGARGAGLTGVWLDRNGVRTPQHEPPVIVTLTELSDYVRQAHPD